MPALEAGELESAALAVSVPHLRERDRRRFFDRMGDTARPRPPAPPIQVIEHNPDKAAEYFRSFGIDVVHHG